MLSKSALSFIGLALIPLAIMLLETLLVPRGLKVGQYPWVIFLAVTLLFLMMIANPVYLIFLAKHYTIKYSVNFVLSGIVIIVSGIGSILILNFERWSKNSKGWDFSSEIMFTVELIVASLILIIGIIVLAYLRLKNKS